MNSRIIAVLFAAYSSFSFFSERANAEQATAEMFGALPNVSEMAISPDGARVAMLQNTESASAVLVYDLEHPDAQPVGARVDSFKARGIEWADNEYVLFLVSSTERVQAATGLETMEFWRWVSVSTKTGKVRSLFTNEGRYLIGSAGTLLATTPDSPGDAIFERIGYNSNGSVITDTRLKKTMQEEILLMLYRVDLKNGRLYHLGKGGPNTREWVVDAAGEPIARVDLDPDQKVRRIMRVTGKSAAKEIATFHEESGEDAALTVYGSSPNPGHLLAAHYDESGRRSLVEMDIETGALGSALFDDKTYDFGEVLYNPRFATGIGVRYIADLPRTAYFDADDQKTQESLRKAIPGAEPMIVSRSKDGSRMIVKAIYTDHPEQFFLFDRSTHSLSMISPTYQALDGKVFAKKEKYDHEASDGLHIPGYLTVPAGAAKKNMPLIVLPHGGPAGRDDQAFDWWSFFYAARGYLVYQPNFRGSDGYGAAFREAGYGEWGRKMQDDITEGVKKLIADGYVDPKRICIVGASYGGYAALAGAAFTPDLYACAVSVSGVSDLPGMIGANARWSDEAVDYWERRIGSRTRDSAELNKYSPSKMASFVKAPVLLIHGKDDTVVPIAQSIVMNDALEANGKTVEFIQLEGEDHWLSRGETRTKMLQTSIDFIDRYIGSKPATASH